MKITEISGLKFKNNYKIYEFDFLIKFSSVLFHKLYSDSNFFLN